MVTKPLETPPVPREVLERAVAIYLDCSYGPTGPPESVKNRLRWPADCPASELLTKPPFERASANPEEVGVIFALRLGNLRYPHMKLQVQGWPNPEGYLLSVNTHDQVLALNPASRDFEAFRALQAENQQLKESIEQAWDEAGLPTFLRYLRTYLANAENDQPEEPGSP